MASCAGIVAPLVSVIIPTFNRWPMIGEAVQSVLAQTYADYELIVVDDGSTDDTGAGLARFGTRLRLFSQSNAGVAAARNLGASRARGRYLAFLDSDDLWRPRKLAVQTSFMERRREVRICQCEEIWLRNGKRVNPKVKHQKPSGDIFLRSLELCLISPSAVMMTRELFERYGGFDETLPVCEDYDLWLRITLDHPVPLIPDPLVVKRGGHSDQLSRSTWGMDRYRVLALHKLLRSGLEGTLRQAVVKVLRAKLSILSQGARKRGKHAEADGYDSMAAEFPGAQSDVGNGNSRLRARAGISSQDTGAVA